MKAVEYLAQTPEPVPRSRTTLLLVSALLLDIRSINVLEIYR